VVCVDAATGALIWRWTGEKELTPRLQPVFSSPVLSPAFKAAAGQEVPAGRYLLCGEGYHTDRDCRLICLDLEPCDAGQPPKLHWAAPTTSHVEATPCVFEGKAYVGAGDDGFWCVDLATGQVAWRLEGAPFYWIADNPDAEALARLAGETVAIVGSARREWPDPTAEPSFVVLSPTRFAVSGSPDFERMVKTPAPAGHRIVVGRIAVAVAPPKGVEGASKVKIEVPAFFPDTEASPVALRLADVPEPRVFFGCGAGGCAFVCVHAETGKIIWRTPTEHPAFGMPAVADGKLIAGIGNATFVTSDPRPAGSVLCLSAADGKELWRVKVGDGILGAVPVSNGVAYACSRDNWLYAIDTRDGRVIKRLDINAILVCSPAVTEKAVYVVTDHGKVYGIKRADLTFLWSHALTPGHPIFSSPTIGVGRLFVGSRGQGLFCLGDGAKP
jgi:outer membrane protein assembly factor BamB